MNIAILGAGIGGLSAAYDLAKAGHSVTIYEAASQPGGLASGFKEPHWDWSVERFYHHWFQTDAHMLGVIRELGWEDKLRFPRPVTVMYHNGRFYPFDSIKNALLYPGLGWGMNKVRFGLVGLYLRLTNNWRALEKTTIDRWMRRWAGSGVYESMWEPMVVGKFSERYARSVNMAWMWARMHSRTTRLGTFEGGFQAFADAFAERLRAMGVAIQLNTPVQRIERTAEGLRIGVAGDQRLFDQALVTTSPALLARLAPGLPEDYLRGLLALKSMGAVVMVLATNQRLSPQKYYWYNIPKTAGFPFLSLVEHTNFLSPAYFGGDHILYVGDYLDPDHEHFQMNEEQLLERFVPGIQRVNPNFNRSWVKKAWLFKTAYAQPIPLVNHSQNIPAIQTPVPGLYFASMSQVYPWDRGTNFAVEIGRRAARQMVGDARTDSAA